MIKAVKNLEKKKKIDYLLLDGNFFIDINIPQKPIIKGDEKVFSCAVASIIAKVTRDRIMVNCHKKYPQYSFNRHKGYSTKTHIKALNKYGVLDIHRLTFHPVKNLLK